MVKKALIVLGIITLSVFCTIVSKNYVIKGADVGGTKGLFSYSRAYSHNFEGQASYTLHYPSSYLRTGMIMSGNSERGGLCTAVNGLPTKAYGWPFYYSIDDPNCGSQNIFPILFMLDVLFFASLFGLFLLLVRRLTKS